MKHAGSQEDLLGAASSDARWGAGRAVWSGQSRVSRVVALGSALFLVTIVADGPVRSLARTLDPSQRAVLRVITELGNSAWALTIGLALLGLIRVLRRRAPEMAPGPLGVLRSALLLLVISVASSGLLASLAKNIIGRVRPSTGSDPQVLEFLLLAFRAGWASFPSGHATTAMATALALAIAFPRYSWACLSVGVAAALSRAFLGVHWLSDCLAGMILGVTVTLAVQARLATRGHDLRADPSGATRAVATLSAEALQWSGKAARQMAARTSGRVRKAWSSHGRR